MIDLLIVKGKDKNQNKKRYIIMLDYTTYRIPAQTNYKQREIILTFETLILPKETKQL